MSYPSQENWRVVIVPNRFPALTHIERCSEAIASGPYLSRTGVGHHDLVITRDHFKNFAELSPEHATEVLAVMKKRYEELAADPCITYASTFYNWGAKAGASLYHPHYQILALPIVPPDVQHSLNGSERYYRKNKKCVHCDMLAYERKVKKRVVLETRDVIIIAPYVSRTSYELRLFPKKHLPFFEKTPGGVMREVSHLLQKTLGLITKRLGDPDLNFFIHTAPLKHQDRYPYYHWHIEIIPKITILAGFELSTGVDINTIDPDYVASFLRPK